MALAEIHKDHIDVQTQWIDKELIKQVPGIRWADAQCGQRCWSLPLAWASCIVLRGVFQGKLNIGPKLHAWGYQERKTRIDPALQLRTQYQYETPTQQTHPDLYQFQDIGVRFLICAQDALLADELGAGKTLQAIVALKTLHEQDQSSLPAIIICPNAVKIHWKNEILKWFPEAAPYVVHGTAAKRREVLKNAKADPTSITIVNIEAVRTFSRLAPFGNMHLTKCIECDKKHGDKDLKPSRCQVHPKELNSFEFKSVIIDESHRLKDARSQQTRACWAILHQPSVQYHWALTGTPIANHPGDLWAIMHGIAKKDFPAKSRYQDRYTLQEWDAFGALHIVGIKPETRTEFFKILDPRLRRMPKSLVLPQLPPKVYIERFVDMSPKQARAYNDIEESMLTRLDNGALLITPTNLSAHTRLLQLSSSYFEIIDKPDPDDISTWVIELREPSPKIDDIIELIEDLGDKQIAIAAEHRKLIELLAIRLDKHKISYEQITGAVPAGPLRDLALQRFQNGEVQLMLFTMKAGGTGLTMTATDTLIRMQRSWSMIDNVQTVGRVDRIGSEKHSSINIIDIITSGTIESEIQFPRLYEKQFRLQEIVRDRQTIIAAGGDTSALDEEEARILNSYVL